MAGYWPSNPGEFWTMAGVLFAVLLVVLGGGWKLIRGAIAKEFEPIKKDNDRLREEIDTRLRFPTYAKDAIELTEKAADRRIENLRIEYEQAMQERDEAGARTIHVKLQEVEALRNNLVTLSRERNELAHRLQHAVVSGPAMTEGNAVGLPTGLILVVRHAGCYGAVQAVDQGWADRGDFIRYAWWFQPHGSGLFTDSRVQTGFTEGRRLPGPGPRPDVVLEVGPIRLLWTSGGDGLGWVYYGPSGIQSPEYELAIANVIDISRMDASKIQLARAPQFR